MLTLISITFSILLGYFVFKFSKFLKWGKLIVHRRFVEIYKKSLNCRFDLYDYSQIHDPRKINFLIPQEEYNLDGPQSVMHILNGQDEIYFYGANSKSEFLIAKINRQLNNKSEACICLKLSSGKIYELVKTLDFQNSSTDKGTFSCGNFQLQCLAPMRRWRLYYAGYLRETPGKNSEINQMIYVQFSLLWRAASDVFDFKTDINAKSIAFGLRNMSWKNANSQIKNLHDVLDFYGQAGVIHGTITIEDNFKDKEFYFFGQRIRYLGSTSHLKELEYYHTLGYVKENGAYLHFGHISDKTVVKDFTFGFIVQSDGDLTEAEDFSVLNFTSENIKLNFKTNVMSFKFDATLQDLSRNRELTNNVIKWIEFDLNGKTGYGIQIKRLASKKLEEVVYETHCLPEPSVVPPVLHFNENYCPFSEISGGKGSSLSKLSQLSNEFQTFNVPQGVVVTTVAYASFVTNYILGEIKLLEEKLNNEESKPEDISEACKRVYEVIIETAIPQNIEKDIVSKMKLQFGADFESISLAIRSSATGEDTEQMSAAGQMETFLGVIGINEILLAIKKCWASQFSFVATKYKRRHGQNINSLMAVVIQEMVPCDVAGVLFTCDPLTGNPTLMSITSNYGLGESVVSGSEDPDMIVLKRNENDQISIKDITIGQKSHKIIAKGEKGTSIENVPENERIICSLSDKMIFQLAHIAIKIEKFYRSHRDIEWGFYNDKPYIFQSRPVTTGTEKTNYEIDHEFDDAMRVENDFYSVANVGEVVPKAFTPLGMCVALRANRLILNRPKKEVIFQLRNQKNYYVTGWLVMYNHFMFNVADVFPVRPNEELSTLKKATILSFFGRIPENEELFEVTRSRYEWIPESNSFSLYTMIMTTLKANKILKQTIKQYSDYRVPIEEYNSAKELYPVLLQANAQLIDVALCFMMCTQTSSLVNMFIFSMLGTAEGEFNNAVYRDFAKLLKTNTEVESADVPSATQSIAYFIAQTIKPEEFKNMSTEDAYRWLLSSESTAGEKFRKFMERHGHRCLQEYDVYSDTWRKNPQMVVQTLQMLTGTVTKDIDEKKEDNWNDLISKMNVKIGYFNKFILRILLPLSRKGIQNREIGKSLLVKGMDEWRKGYWQLAELMVKEGRIPEKELLFFMDFVDIQHLLDSRSPKIIARATQRMRRYTVVRDYRFPEIMKGFPRPLNDDESNSISNEINFEMKGIPVSQGVAKGFIRKALTLEEAAFIKPGEILLTFGTDIGWTPYFPYLSGVVTELGGLISHGAVVSREYRIPCIAGLHGATKQFQTGDFVLLDGNKGVLQKLQASNN